MSDAVIQLREAIALSPANPDLHSLLSQALAGTGQLEQAIAERKAALHLRANDADDWNNLGVLEARAGRIAEAREDFRPRLAARARSCASAQQSAASAALLKS